jgi:hypothetical protein
VRPTTPNPLTLEEHRELGMEVRKIRARIHELCNLVVDVYGPNDQAAFTFLKVAEAIDRLRADMQIQAAHDWPGHSTDGFYE